MRVRVQTENAPAAIGPYSQAIKAGGFVFVSGQIPIDPKTGQFVSGGIGEQTERVLKNLAAVLEASREQSRSGFENNRFPGRHERVHRNERRVREVLFGSTARKSYGCRCGFAQGCQG